MPGELKEDNTPDIRVECAPVDMTVGELRSLRVDVELQERRGDAIVALLRPFSHFDFEEIDKRLGLPDVIGTEQKFALRHPDLGDFEVNFVPFGMREGMLWGKVSAADDNSVVPAIAKRYKSLGIDEDMICLALSGDEAFDHLAVLRETMDGDVELCIAAAATDEIDHDEALTMLQEAGL